MILFIQFLLTLPGNDKEVVGVGSSNEGIADIAANTERSHMLVIEGRVWAILGWGIGTWHVLRLDEEVEGVPDVLEGVADIVANIERSHMLAIKGGVWAILGWGIDIWHVLRTDEEVEGVLDAIG